MNGNQCECKEMSADGECQLCGNGVRDPGEACDDGNVENLDGCNSHCAIEASSICSGGTSLTTDSCHHKRTLSISKVEATAEDNIISLVILLSDRVTFKSKLSAPSGFSQSNIQFEVSSVPI